MEVDHLVYKMMVSLATMTSIAVKILVSGDASKKHRTAAAGSATKRPNIRRSSSTFLAIT
jgi:hypothetical protein